MNEFQIDLQSPILASEDAFSASYDHSLDRLASASGDTTLDDALARVGQFGWSMPQNPKDFLAALRATTTALAGASDEPSRDHAAEIGRSVFRQTCHTLLNMMGTSGTTVLRDVHDDVYSLISQDPRDIMAWESLSPQRQFLYRLQVVSEMVGVFLDTPSHARYGPILSGERYRPWRLALLTIASLNRIARVADVRPHFKGRRTTATEALKRLVEEGLLRRESIGATDVGYMLTWAGRGLVEQIRGESHEESGDPTDALEGSSVQAAAILPAENATRGRLYQSDEGLKRSGLDREGLLKEITGRKIDFLPSH